jgi:hypothetical protein
VRIDDDLVIGTDQLEYGVDLADWFTSRQRSERQGQQQGGAAFHVSD